MASGELATSLPFAGTLAWTALLLAGASRFVRATGWPVRLAWGVAAAVAWGQLAAAHFSVGLVMGTGALVTFLMVVAWQRWGIANGAGLRQVAVLAGVLLAMGVAINLAYFLPRLQYLPRTDLSEPYVRLVKLGVQISGMPAAPAVGASSGLMWPLKLATFPGVYLGGVALLLSLAGLWSRRWRSLVVGFAVYGAVGYVLTLSVVSRRVPMAWWTARPVDLYLHSPEWFGYLLLPVIGVLAAAGVDAWTEPRPHADRVRMVAPGAVLWLLMPAALGAGVSHVVPVLAGFVVGGAMLVWVAVRPRLAPVLVLVLAIELTTLGTAGNHDRSLPFKPLPVLLQAVANPSLHASAFLDSGPILGVITQDGVARYMKLPRPGKSEPLPPTNVHGMLANHSLMFGTEDTGTFNPVQPFRYWVFVRASQRLTIKYNRAYFVDPPRIALDLLQVGWFVAPRARPVPEGVTMAAIEGSEPWVLYRRDEAPPRAQVVPAWRVLPDQAGAVYPDPALGAILAPGFDANGEVILDREPGLGAPAGVSPGAAAGSAAYTWRGDKASQVIVDAPAPSVILVRNGYDPGWHAEVDGVPAEVMRADYFLQGVAVPAGHHVIELRYDDPAVGYGLAGSLASLLAIAAIALVLRRRARVPPPDAAPPP
jgi:hypothetical protein